jgi:hypothetical protein
MNSIWLKPKVNKNNKQISFTLPKKKLPKEIYDKIDKLKAMRIKEDAWLFE